MDDELAAVIEIAKNAGKIVSSYFGKEFSVEYKQDEFDPVTSADKESDQYIRGAIHKLFPDDEILSEEHEARPSSYAKRVWMVDPLDGTKEFIAGRGSFAVMIGLLDNNIPRLGVVYSPITDELFYAVKNKGAFYAHNGKSADLSVGSVTSLNDATLITRHKVERDIRPLDEQVNSLAVKARIPEGSIGLKLGRIAQNKADLFIHTNTHGCKWDTLAPQVILAEAGGGIVDLAGDNLDYTKESVDWDKYFIAASNTTLLNEALKQIKLPERLLR